jgi:XRE family aerobic/anaerobic benzoate catabolism transcriptional regulator
MTDRVTSDAHAHETDLVPGADASEEATSADTRRGDEYLVMLGQRVRDMRAMRGMSRKVLARVSGISERYIAQLESGQGNVSILLLRRVCAAIGLRLEDLIAERGAETPDALVVRDLLRSATGDELARVRAMLSGGPRAVEAGPSHRAQRVALIGLRGAGKSTLGRIVADRLGWPFVELNAEIERANALSVPEIFAIYGQEGYRRFEQSCLRDLIARPGPMVMATGGGVVAEPLTFDLLLSSFFTVWLKAQPEEHMSRVRAQGDLRPMADDRGAMHELRAILHSRESLYARAEVTVDTAGATPERSAAILADVIAARAGLDRPTRVAS